MIHQVKHCANLRSQRCDTWSEFDSGEIQKMPARGVPWQQMISVMFPSLTCLLDSSVEYRRLHQTQGYETRKIDPNLDFQVSKDHGGKGSHPGYFPCREISRLAKFASGSPTRCWQGPDVFTTYVISFLVFPSQLSYIQNFNCVAVGTKYTKYMAEH